MEPRKRREMIPRVLMEMFLLLIVGFVSGCGTSIFTKPITTYRESYEAAAPILGEYISGMNDFEREVYLQDALFDNSKMINLREGGRPTPLLGKRFSAKSIAARMDAIRLLGVYTERLAALAGSDAPERFASATTELGQAFEGLEQQFRELGGGSDDTATNYVGPISSVVAAIGQTFLEAQRDAAVRNAIEQGREPVDNILRLLEADFREIINLQRESGLRQLLASVVEYYNTNRGELEFAERRQCIQNIEELARRYNALIASNPVLLIEAMRDANEALYQFAQAPERDEGRVEMLIAALTTFAARVESTAGAVRQIRGEEE